MNADEHKRVLEPELRSILTKHFEWLLCRATGERADLRNRDLSYADLSHTDLSRADLRGADLSNANLYHADLREADLSGANLSDADLRDAILRNANLSNADLTGVQLYNAMMKGADLRGVNLQDVPSIPNIDMAILDAVNKPYASLDMITWHTCATSHCRAGWAIHLAGDAGYDLEALQGPEAAGALIYAASGSHPVPDFHAVTQEAIEDMRTRAAKGGVR